MRIKQWNIVLEFHVHYCRLICMASIKSRRDLRKLYKVHKFLQNFLKDYWSYVGYCPKRNRAYVLILNALNQCINCFPEENNSIIQMSLYACVFWCALCNNLRKNNYIKKSLFGFTSVPQHFNDLACTLIKPSRTGLSFYDKCCYHHNWSPGK